MGTAALEDVNGAEGAFAATGVTGQTLELGDRRGGIGPERSEQVAGSFEAQHCGIRSGPRAEGVKAGNVREAGENPLYGLSW